MTSQVTFPDFQELHVLKVTSNKLIKIDQSNLIILRKLTEYSTSNINLNQIYLYTKWKINPKKLDI